MQRSGIQEHIVSLDKAAFDANIRLFSKSAYGGTSEFTNQEARLILQTNKRSLLKLYVFFTVHFHKSMNKISTNAHTFIFKLIHLHVSAQKGHLQGVKSLNTNTLITICPKYSHCIQM